MIYELRYSKIGVEYIPDLWKFGTPIRYTAKEKIYDGYAEYFNILEEARKRKNELKITTNKKYINFKIYGYKNVYLNPDFDTTTLDKSKAKLIEG